MEATQKVTAPGRALDVFINANKIGTLNEANDLWRFDYEPSWSQDPNGYSLSPALDRKQLAYIDGGSNRPVQWYFDNLLPEENMRVILAEEAKRLPADAFGLLQYFGAESAGSLVLYPSGTVIQVQTGRQELADEALHDRIMNLPRLSLSDKSPKKMSLAGAQHKLAVIYEEGKLYEPEQGDVSTHILKPDSPNPNYPSSVINEYFVMKLASSLKLKVPNVYRHYCPEPVYVIERFDRRPDTDPTQRLHTIDACQLLNKSRSFKYTEANVDTLNSVLKHVRNKASARLWIYQWIVVNVLVGNADNHLKNISFLVSKDGINISPGYDLLSTAVYTTRAFANEKATWPNADLALPLPGVTTYKNVTRSNLIDAGKKLGLKIDTLERELARILKHILPAADALIAEIEEQNKTSSEACKIFHANEMRVLRTIRHIIIQDMVSACSALP